jgi:cytochrome c oxidase subunit 1
MAEKGTLGNPVFSGMFISLIGLGFIGGISGVVMGTEQINIIIHNTIYVPGHFHATVVIGTTLAFMSLTYFLIPVSPCLSCACCVSALTRCG